MLPLLLPACACTAPSLLRGLLRPLLLLLPVLLALLPADDVKDTDL
jgi:hypothetical protein